MKIILSFLFILITSLLYAQQETFDLITYTPLKGWDKETKENVIVFSKIDKDSKTWCQIGVYKSTTSKGSIEDDIKSEWEVLAAKQYNITDPMQPAETHEADGWKIKAASGQFTFNDQPAAAILTTFSGYNRCVSIVAITNAQRYLETIEKFVGDINIKKPETVPAINTPSVSGYAFTTTNFDDGWTSTAQEDWVEVVKGNIKVLLHYPKEGTTIPADPEPHVNNAWNILTAPRYSNLRNYRTAYIQTYNRPYLGMGSLTDNATGKEVYVVLFRQGQSGWIEFIMPDKNDFIQQYKFDPETIAWNSESDLLNPLVQMANYNKFGVAASDFNGSWTSDFTGVQQLYHVYTGNYAGMHINQSKEVFEFTSPGSYKWNLLVVNGMAGATNYAQVKSSGKLQVVNNWQITCSDIEGKPKKYHAFFSCIKGARLLKLLDADYPGSGIPTVFGKK